LIFDPRSSSYAKRWLRLSAVASCALFALGIVSCRNHDFPEYAANYHEFAYVTNGGNDTVSVFDVVNLRLDRQLQVGQNPSGVTANPKRDEVYVVNSGSGQANGSVSIIDSIKNSVAATIAVGRRPYSIDVDPSGDLAYVANSGSDTVSVLDLKARRAVAEIKAGAGPGLARVSANGKTLLVSNRSGNSVSIFEIISSAGSVPVTYRLRKVIDGCAGATDAVILTDSNKAFVACSGGHQVMAVRLAHGNDGASEDVLEAMLDVGRSPVHLALKPEGGQIFVSNFDSDSISEIDTTTDDVGGAYIMGSKPVRGIVSGDNSLLYVSNFNSQELTVYSIDDGKRVTAIHGAASIHVGDGPDSLAFSAHGNLLFVADARSGDVAVVRTSTLTLFTLLPTGRQPNGIAMKSFKLH
jgi:YVTN family beta-propeller protein